MESKTESFIGVGVKITKAMNNKVEEDKEIDEYAMEIDKLCSEIRELLDATPNVYDDSNDFLEKAHYYNLLARSLIFLQELS